LKMKRSERAKIFMPFSPLKGFHEALRRKERVLVPKAELAEERMAELDGILRTLSGGDMIQVVYYCDGIYEKVTGCVGSIDGYAKTLTVAKRSISFDDIYDLKLL